MRAGSGAWGSISSGLVDTQHFNCHRVTHHHLVTVLLLQSGEVAVVADSKVVVLLQWHLRLDPHGQDEEEGGAGAGQAQNIWNEGRWVTRRQATLAIQSDQQRKSEMFSTTTASHPFTFGLNHVDYYALHRPNMELGPSFHSQDSKTILSRLHDKQNRQ